MKTRFRPLVMAGVLALASTALAGAQDPGPEPAPPDTGEMAPDFAIRGATRYGLLSDAGRLSDFRGKTVVLAFFARARTRG